MSARSPVWPALVVCGGVLLFWVTNLGATRFFGESSGIALVLPAIVLLAFSVVLPIGMLALTRNTGRFWRGLLVTCAGHVAGLVLCVPTTVLLAPWAYRGQAPTQFGQGVGILAMLIVAAGITSSPVVGGLAALGGAVVDRIWPHRPGAAV